MASPHFSPPSAKRVLVQFDNNPRGKWLLVPPTSRTVQDLLNSLVLRLSLPPTSTYDLWLHDNPIHLSEDIALVQQGDKLQLRVLHDPSATPTNSQPSLTPPHMAPASIQQNDAEQSGAQQSGTQQNQGRKKRVLSAEGKRRRNGRNRQREKRRRLERRQSLPQLPVQSLHPSDNLQVENDVPQQTGPAICPTADPPFAVVALAPDLDRAPPNPTAKSQHNSDQRPKQTSSSVTTPATNPEENVNCKSVLPAIPVTDVTPQTPASRHFPETSRLCNEAVETISSDTTTQARSRGDPHIPQQNFSRPISLPESQPLPPSTAKHPAALPHAHGSRRDATALAHSSQKQGLQNSYILLRQNVSVQPVSASLAPSGHGGTRKKTMSPGIQDNARTQLPMNPRVTDNQKVTRKLRVIPRVETAANAEKRSAQAITAKGTEHSFAHRHSMVSKALSTGTHSNRLSNPEASRTNLGDAEIMKDGIEKYPEAGVLQANSDAPQRLTCAATEIEFSSAGRPTTSSARSPPEKDDVQKGSNLPDTRRGSVGENVQPSSKPNPRGKQRRLEENKHSSDRPESSIMKGEDVRNFLEDLSSQRNTDIQEIDRLEEQARRVQSEKAETPVASEKVSTKPSARDVINLVDDNDDELRAVDSLPMIHQSPKIENCLESTSPQSIVVTPNEPQAVHLSARHLEEEVSKKRSAELPKRDDASLSRTEREDAHHDGDLQAVGASRRKPRRPKRLNKPASSTNSNSTDRRQKLVSEELSYQTGKHFDTLETLKQVVVNDLQTAERGNPSPKGEVPLSPSGGSVCNAPKSHETSNSLEFTEPDTRIDGKKKRSSLKGGLSTLEALRVAKAHGAIASSAEKDQNKVNAPDSEMPSPYATVTPPREAKGLRLDLPSVKNICKKRKRSKRSRKAQSRYLNEEQINRSIFIGYDSRPEMLLPPPELLELPEGADDLIFRNNEPTIPEHSNVNVQPSLNASSEQRGEAQVASENADNAPEDPSCVAIEAERRRSKDGQTCTIEERSDKRSANNQEGNDVMPTEPTRLGSQNPTARTDNAVGKTRMHECSPAKDRSNRSRNGDCFREDLVNMLQQTTKTLAAVWSKWES